VLTLLEAACAGVPHREDYFVLLQTTWLPASSLSAKKKEWSPFFGYPASVMLGVRDEKRPERGIESIVRAEIWFAEDSGRVLSFRLGDGAVASNQQLAELEQELRSTAKLDDAVVATRLTAIGAKFPPGRVDLTRQRIVAFLEAIEPLVGKARVETISFDWRPESPSENVFLQWRVEAVTSTRNLTIRMEPVNGNIQSMW